jgi:hypothetical protein
MHSGRTFQGRLLLKRAVLPMMMMKMMMKLMTMMTTMVIGGLAYTT